MKIKLKKTLFDDHAKKLHEESGISEDTVRKNGVISLSKDAVREKLKRNDVDSPGICFPYPAREGYREDLFSIRLDVPIINNEGKEVKYLRPAGVSNGLYIPRDVWEELGDVSIPLIFTEGCKKALAATERGFLTISVDGVWGWSANKKLLMGFSKIKLKGRLVYLCFDSDKNDNEHVALAEKRFAEHLEKKGAKVRIIDLPAGYKMDDFLKKHGKDAFQKLVDSAKAFGYQTKEEILNILSKKKDLIGVHPAQDFKDGKMFFSVVVDGARYLLLSDHRMIPFEKVAAEGFELTNEYVTTFRFSAKGLERFLNEDSFPVPMDLYREIRNYVARYVVFPFPEYLTLIAVWIMGTYVFKVFRYFPYLWINAEKGSGKSHLLEVICPLVFHGEIITDPTEAVIFRDISNNLTSLLIDEVETLNSKNKDERAAILTILNTGFNMMGLVKRACGENFQLQSFNTYSPKVLAGINDIWDVLKDRTLPTRMLRKKPSEKVERFKTSAEINSLQVALRDELYLFALENAARIAEHYHSIDKFDGIDHLTNRELDIWEPLLVLAWLIDQGNDGSSVFDELVMLSQRIFKERKRDNVAENETYKLVKVVMELLKKPPVEKDGSKYTYKAVDVFIFFKDSEEFSWLKTSNTLTSRFRKIGVLSLQKRIDGKKKRFYEIDEAKVSDFAERYGV